MPQLCVKEQSEQESQSSGSAQSIYVSPIESSRRLVIKVLVIYQHVGGSEWATGVKLTLCRRLSCEISYLDV